MTIHEIFHSTQIPLNHFMGNPACPHFSPPDEVQAIRSSTGCLFFSDQQTKRGAGI